MRFLTLLILVFQTSQLLVAQTPAKNRVIIWFEYPEAGTLKKTVKFNTAENLYRVSLSAPVVEQTQSTHFILKVTDKGKPSLSRYKRVIVNIMP